jgi:hypothetical protein
MGCFPRRKIIRLTRAARLVCAANIRLTCAARLVRVEGSRKLIFRLKMRVGGKNAVRQYWKRAFFRGFFKNF